MAPTRTRTQRSLAGLLLLLLPGTSCYTQSVLRRPAAEVFAPAPEHAAQPLRVRLVDGRRVTLFGPHYRTDRIAGYVSPTEAAAKLPGTDTIVFAQQYVREVQGLNKRSVLVTLRSGRMVTAYLPIAEQRVNGGDLQWLRPSDSVPFQWVATDVEPEHGIALADIVRMETVPVDALGSGGIIGLTAIAALALTAIAMSQWQHELGHDLGCSFDSAANGCP